LGYDECLQQPRKAVRRECRLEVVDVVVYTASSDMSSFTLWPGTASLWLGISQSNMMGEATFYLLSQVPGRFKWLVAIEIKTYIATSRRVMGYD